MIEKPLRDWASCVACDSMMVMIDLIIETDKPIRGSLYVMLPLAYFSMGGVESST